MAGTNTIKQQAAGAGVTGAGQAKAALRSLQAAPATAQWPRPTSSPTPRASPRHRWWRARRGSTGSSSPSPRSQGTRSDTAGSAWAGSSPLQAHGPGALTCLTSILNCYAMSVLPAPVALTLLFQFTWLGLVWQTVMTRRPPRPLKWPPPWSSSSGTVFASGVYKTGITGYDPVALLCALGAAVSCSLFVTLSGKVEAPCSSEQRGVIVCAGSVVMSLTVCPDYVVSGVLAQGILPFAVIAGFFGMLCPVLLFGMGSPHLPAGLSTVMAAAELPAGLFIAMIVLGEPLGVVEWLGVAIILAGVLPGARPTP